MTSRGCVHTCKLINQFCHQSFRLQRETELKCYDWQLQPCRYFVVDLMCINGAAKQWKLDDQIDINLSIICLSNKKNQT